MNRKDEVREILALDTDELVRRANGQLVLFPTLDEVYDYLAEEMVKEFEMAAAGDRIVSFIMPVGPTQPYRLMAEKINYRQLSLKNVRFFFMDEYVDEEKDELIPETHPLSFRGQIGPLLFNRIRPDRRNRHPCRAAAGHPQGSGGPDHHRDRTRAKPPGCHRGRKISTIRRQHN